MQGTRRKKKEKPYRIPVDLFDSVEKIGRRIAPGEGEKERGRATPIWFFLLPPLKRKKKGEKKGVRGESDH